MQHFATIVTHAKDGGLSRLAAAANLKDSCRGAHAFCSHSDSNHDRIVTVTTPSKCLKQHTTVQSRQLCSALELWQYCVDFACPSHRQILFGSKGRSFGVLASWD